MATRSVKDVGAWDTEKVKKKKKDSICGLKKPFNLASTMQSTTSVDYPCLSKK